MKLKIFIDKDHEEEVIVYTRKGTELVSAIEKLINQNDMNLMGFNETEVVPLTAEEVFCFISENGKVYAITEKEKLLIRQRLYQLEENLSDDFLKINQSCLANVKRIARFDTSISGNLTVRFRNGYTDYVSRRNLRNIKERFWYIAFYKKTL